MRTCCPTRKMCKRETPLLTDIYFFLFLLSPPPVFVLIAQTEGDAGYDYDAAYDGLDYDDDPGRPDDDDDGMSINFSYYRSLFVELGHVKYCVN